MKTCLLGLAALSGLSLISGCDRTSDTEALAVVAPAEALCRPTANGRDATGCYVTLTASRDDRLVSVSSPISARAEVHEMKVENNIMTMRQLTEGLALPAGEAVVLRPGGNHIMLMGLTQPLKAGETVSLTLSFEHAGPVGVRARVEHPAIATRAGHH